MEFQVNTAVENYISTLKWSDEVSDETRTLVAGNIRGAVGALLNNGTIVARENFIRRIRRNNNVYR